jgi:hypothetical protein
MRRKLDRWTTALTATLVLGALLACKKKKEPEAAPANSAPVPVASVVPTAEPPKDAVKRYGGNELAETGTVRVKAIAKVFREADAKTEAIISLSPGTLVNRKARMTTFTLIEYPTGVGELSPGWIETKFIETRVVTKLDAGVLNDAGVKPKVDAGTPTPAVSQTATPPVPEAAAPTTPPVTTATPDAGRVRRIPKRLGQ